MAGRAFTRPAPSSPSGGLYAFVVPSPKRSDLDRDGRFELHAFAPEHVDDECYVTGTVKPVDDPETLRVVAEAYHHDPRPDEAPYEFDLDRCMIAW